MVCCAGSSNSLISHRWARSALLALLFFWMEKKFFSFRISFSNNIIILLDVCFSRN